MSNTSADQSRVPAQFSLDDLVDRARSLAEPGSRRILGIAGPPGAGKSTVCEALSKALGDSAVLVGMDAFHLSNRELVRLGRRQRKGAPDTFDVEGYLVLLRRLRHQGERVIYAPLFDRAIEESIGAAVPVEAATPLVITEGNYLLSDDHGWHDVAALLDESWYLSADTEELHERLLARRQSYGETVEQATAWVVGVDEPNARFVEASQGRADLVVRVTAPSAEADGS